MSSSYKVEVAVKNSCRTVGEGPHWEADSKCLMYVDINAGDVHRWNSETNEDTKLHVGKGSFNITNILQIKIITM